MVTQEVGALSLGVTAKTVNRAEMWEGTEGAGVVLFLEKQETVVQVEMDINVAVREERAEMVNYMVAGGEAEMVAIAPREPLGLEDVVETRDLLAEQVETVEMEGIRQADVEAMVGTPVKETLPVSLVGEVKEILLVRTARLRRRLRGERRIFEQGIILDSGPSDSASASINSD